MVYIQKLVTLERLNKSNVRAYYTYTTQIKIVQGFQALRKTSQTTFDRVTKEYCRRKNNFRHVCFMIITSVNIFLILSLY